MASTVFTDKATVINTTWLNDVNGIVWTVFNGATTAALARTALGATSIGSSLFTAATAAAGRTAITAAASGVNTDITSLSTHSLATNSAVNEARTTVASAAGADIWTTTGNTIDYTGTVTATGFAAAPQAGARRTLICAGAAVFTAGANMIIPGVASGNNYVAVANEKIDVFAITTTQFLLAVPSKGMQLLDVKTAVAQATVDFTVGINSTYDEFLIIITNMIAATDNTILTIRLSQSASFVSGAASYAYSAIGQTDAGAPANIAASASATFIGLNANTSNAKPLSGEVRFYGIGSAGTQKTIRGDLVYQPSGGTLAISSGAGAFIANTTAIDGIRFLMNSGNITSGNFALYGIRKT